MNIETIERNVIQWGKDRDIYSQSNITSQLIKLKEEVQEIEDAYSNSEQMNLLDAIGDCMVVLTHIAHMAESDLFSSFLCAWSEIKDRKGKMMDGIFVKEEQ